MALYMMVLFIMPCTDMVEKNLTQIQNHSTEIAHQETHKHDEAQDLCTPFCLCNCCGMVTGVVLQQNFFEIEIIQPLALNLPKPKLYYKTVFLPRYYGEIWQPPKIIT